jgi:uncharacterized repeat protein (TIGR02543 family)
MQVEAAHHFSEVIKIMRWNVFRRVLFGCFFLGVTALTFGTTLPNISGRYTGSYTWDPPGTTIDIYLDITQGINGVSSIIWFQTTLSYNPGKGTFDGSALHLEYPETGNPNKTYYTIDATLSNGVITGRMVNEYGSGANLKVTLSKLWTPHSLNLSATNGIVTSNPDLSSYPDGGQVLLTATAATGYTFKNWSASATGTNSQITVTMNGDKNITANFAPTIPTYTLSVAATNGAVEKGPDQPSYDSGTQVDLWPESHPGYTFKGWSGDASGTDIPLTLTMDADKSITATFIPITYTLNVTAVHGKVATNPPDQSGYAPGTSVTLTETADDGYTFTGWSGDANGQEQQTTVTMGADKNITANFTQIISPPPPNDIEPTLDEVKVKEQSESDTVYSNEYEDHTRQLFAVGDEICAELDYTPGSASNNQNIRWQLQRATSPAIVGGAGVSIEHKRLPWTGIYTLTFYYDRNRNGRFDVSEGEPWKICLFEGVPVKRIGFTVAKAKEVTLTNRNVVQLLHDAAQIVRQRNTISDYRALVEFYPTKALQILPRYVPTNINEFNALLAFTQPYNIKVMQGFTGKYANDLGVEFHPPIGRLRNIVVLGSDDAVTWAHEIGHAIGLDHADTTGRLMSKARTIIGPGILTAEEAQTFMDALRVEHPILKGQPLSPDDIEGFPDE